MCLFIHIASYWWCLLIDILYYVCLLLHSNVIALYQWLQEASYLLTYCSDPSVGFYSPVDCVFTEASLLKPRPEGGSQRSAKEELDQLYSMLEQPWNQPGSDATRREKKLVTFEGIGPTDDQTGVPIATRIVSIHNILMYWHYYNAVLLGGRIKRCTRSVCPSVCSMPKISSKSQSRRNFSFDGDITPTQVA